jgi:peptidoglycan hydrolase CwlO-like protein
MEVNEIIMLLGGISISVISYFLKRTMDQIKDISEITYENKTKLEVMQTDYLNKISRLDEKFSLLYEAIKELTKKIEKLNEKI